MNCKKPSLLLVCRCKPCYCDDIDTEKRSIKRYSKKCKKIAIIADTTSIWTASERIEAFKQAILSRGVDIRNTQIITDIHTSEDASDATLELLKTHPDIDGIIATNDLIAMGVGQTVAASEISVRVVSFDGKIVSRTATTSLSESH